MICVCAATDNDLTNNYQWSNYGRLGHEQYGLLVDSLDDVPVRGRVCDTTLPQWRLTICLVGSVVMCVQMLRVRVVKYVRFMVK